MVWVSNGYLFGGNAFQYLELSTVRKKYISLTVQYLFALHLAPARV